MKLTKCSNLLSSDRWAIPRSCENSVRRDSETLSINRPPRSIHSASPCRRKCGPLYTPLRRGETDTLSRLPYVSVPRKEIVEVCRNCQWQEQSRLLDTTTFVFHFRVGAKGSYSI